MEKNRSFRLKNVKITDSYLTDAFEKEIQYLLSLEADRLLVGFAQTNGIKTDFVRYGGWENTQIQGHTMGHYLTALAQAYVGTKNEEVSKRVDYLCRELKRCQRADGYLFASSEELFDKVENKEPAWVPWYTMHKVLAGLVSAAQLTGNKDAYDTAVKLGDWICNRALAWNEDTQKQVLSVEYGGMNDVLYDLYRLTGNKRFAEGAHRFDEMDLFESLSQGKDVLNQLHANTTIPKIIGAMNRYMLTGEEFYFKCAKNFWEIVVNHHTYITGGNSEWEHFGEADVLDAERTACNAETCNTYNMLKLSKMLFSVTADSKYMDFYERTWFNAILGSRNPQTGMTMYFQPMQTGYFKVFTDPYHSFWCCTGTGMENFTKLQDGICYHNEKELIIARYISCDIYHEDWKTEFHLEAKFPESNKIVIQIPNSYDGEGILALRIPKWTHNQFELKIDGSKIAPRVEEGFVRLPIRNSKIIELNFYPRIEAHALVDNENVVAFTYGPLVLAAGLGKRDMCFTHTGVNVRVPRMDEEEKDYLLVKGATPQEWIKNIEEMLVRTNEEDERLLFKLRGTDEDENYEFIPYMEQYQQRYGIYWNIYPDTATTHKMLEKRAEERKRL
ncbi:MAG TPA: beta-L-arabinofuranosidase domain-containing protein, partial [Lachnospiraceae bacterium]